MNNYKIVTDSSADVLSFPGIAFASAPLKIITAEAEYVDNGNLDVKDMVQTLLSQDGKISTSCPNPQDWLTAFGDAETVFCVTITAKLSGSYNAAMVAKELYESEYPGRHVFVINSQSTGPEMKLLIEKISEGIAAGKDGQEIADSVQEYKKKTGLLFMLESMKNLSNNGRVSPLVAKIGGLLGIRVVGTANQEGNLQLLDKCRGQEKSLAAIVNRMKELGVNSGKVHIAHCFNERAAQKLKELLHAEFSKLKIEYYACRGLCSFYAEKGGLLVGFERC